MADQLISSLAILKVNRDIQRSDYIENFVPFVAQCISILKPAVISSSDIQAKMLNEFGFNIPLNVIDYIIKRAAKRKYIKPDGHVYVPNFDELNKLKFESLRQAVLRDHTALVDKLSKYVFDKHNTIWTIEQAEEALLSYINQFDVDILASSVTGKPIVKSPIQSTGERYFNLIRFFIKHLYETDQQGFQFLETVIKGHMLANALLFPDPNSISQKFKRATVYCDTPLLLRALGFHGTESKAPCEELLSLLKELGAEIRCFRDTYNEVFNILYKCKINLYVTS